MSPQWNLPPETEFIPRPKEIVDVLVEFNGPQMVIASGRDGEFLGVAADETDGGLVRWIYTPLSHTAKAALLAGVTTPNALFQCDQLTIEDQTEDGIPQQGWAISSDMVDPAFFPLAGILLPIHVRTSNALAAQEAPELRFDGKPVSSNTIPFRSLAAVLSSLQKLWTALAQAIESTPTARGSVTAALKHRSVLAAGVMSAGSVRLQIRQDDVDLFLKTAVQYQELVSATANDDTIRATITSLKSRVRSAFLEYLESLEAADVEVFARWGRTGAFISPGVAKRLRSRVFRLKPTSKDETTFEGYFVSINWKSGTFEAVDADDDEQTYKGGIAPSVVVSNTIFKVGKQALYSMRVSTESFSDGTTSQTSYRLEEATEIGRG